MPAKNVRQFHLSDVYKEEILSMGPQRKLDLSDNSTFSNSSYPELTVDSIE